MERLPDNYNGQKYIIHRHTFERYSSITSIIISDGVTKIDAQAFWCCDGIKSVIIGNSVTNIENQAFYGCSSLTNIYYKGTAEEWNNIDIDWGNENLVNATRYYYSETAQAGCWHYGTDGVTPVLW